MNTTVHNLKIQKENYNFIKKLLKKPEDFYKEDFKQKACFSEAYKKYGFLETWESALLYLNNLQTDKSVFNELIPEGFAVKPYLDVEWFKEDFPDLVPEEVILDIKTNLMKMFETDFEYPISQSDIYVSRCHRQKNQCFKFSYHIVVSTKPTVVFENANFASYVAYKLRDMVYFDPELIDVNPYKKTQNLRMLHHSKPDEFIPFKPDNVNDNPLNYLVTNIDKSSIYLRSDEQVDQMHTKINTTQTIEKDDNIILDQIIEKVRVYHPTATFEGVNATGFAQFNYTDRKEPCFSDGVRTHEKLGFYVYLNDDIILAGCYSGNCTNQYGKKKIQIIGSLADTTDLQYEPVSEDNEFKVDHNLIKQSVLDGPRGLSKMFLSLYKTPQRIKWSESSERNGSIYYWNGGIWELDNFDYLDSLTPAVLVNILRKFCKTFEDKGDDLVDKFSKLDEEILKRAKALIESLNKGQYLAQIKKWVTPELREKDFGSVKDVHPYRLACKNGMLDLKTGIIRPTIPEDNVTRLLNTNYNHDADTSTFDNFVREITKDPTGTTELYDYIRWLVGYACQGEPSKKMFFILWGVRGYNGKSLFVNTISDVLGDYATAMDASIVLDAGMKSGGGHSTELIQLDNKRLGILNDTKEGCKLDDGKIKQLTGISDKISAREIYEKQRTFVPKFVPIINTNNRIKMNLTDPALYQRLVLIPFYYSFVENPVEEWELKSDDTLDQKLKQNPEGVLKWIVDCSTFFHQNPNYPVPERILAAKEEYRKDMSIHMEFVDKYYDKHNADGENPEDFLVKKAELLDTFKSYCSEIGERFSIKREEEQFLKLLNKKVLKKITYFAGLSMKEVILED